MNLWQHRWVSRFCSVMTHWPVPCSSKMVPSVLMESDSLSNGDHLDKYVFMIIYDYLLAGGRHEVGCER